MMVAIKPVLRVTAGSTKLWRVPRKPSPMPWEGNHPMFREKIITSKSPSQNLGMDTETRAPTVATLSRRVYCFLADRMPKGIPTAMANTMPQEARSIVLGNRAISWSDTGSRVL